MNKAIIVGARQTGDRDFEASMEELSALAEAGGFEVIGEFVQNVKSINPATYIGSGKIKELYELCRNMEADTVIFNNELSPSQLTNITKEIDTAVYDRTYLILEIFSTRAKTKESVLQVESARLSYMLPRLTGIGASMSRQGGGSGLHNRGAGETKTELNRRKIEKRIADIRKELKNIEGIRERQRARREKNRIPTVALVGYTNAGKSTVMNAMIAKYRGGDPDKLVFEKDMLFATLETSTRSIPLEGGKSFLLSDTVGFVSNLPHALVKAFRSTLEEAAVADLLIHVVDVSNKNYENMIDVTNKTLTEIGAGGVPVLYAYNKAELTDIKPPYVVNGGVYISAKNKTGIYELTEEILKRL